MTIKKLSEVEIKKLLDYKKTGQYINKRNSPVSKKHLCFTRKILFETLYKAMKYKNALHCNFKYKNFMKNMKNINCRYNNIFNDVPLTKGEWCRAIAYGNEHGFLRQINHPSQRKVWCFDNTDMLERESHHRERIRGAE